MAKLRIIQEINLAAYLRQRFKGALISVSLSVAETEIRKLYPDLVFDSAEMGSAITSLIQDNALELGVAKNENLVISIKPPPGH